MRLVSAIYTEFYPFDHLPFVKDMVASNDPAILQAGDILIVWGGADISPSLYNKEVSKHTYASAKLSTRDSIEWAMMQRAKELGIPIIGVCRGAQMLCALAGGYLIQHVNGHGGTHEVKTIDDTVVNTNSIHHQMLHPWGVKHEMLAWLDKQISDVHLDVNTDVAIPCEPEYVYFPEVKGFAIQWHPEMMQVHSEATKFVFKTIKERVNA